MRGLGSDQMIPRSVREDEIDDLIGWGMPLFKHRFPRCTRETILPLLKIGVSSGRMRFVRTENAAGLFVADVTPWEPMATVNEVVVGSRMPSLEIMSIYRAGKEWAQEIGACEYNYGASTGIDLEPIARRIGYDRRWQGYTLTLTKEPMVA